MDEIRRRDIKVFARELLSPGKVLLLVLAALMTGALANPWSPFPVWQVVFGWMLLLGLHGWTSWRSSILRRFKDQRFLVLWTACEERHERFRGALKQAGRAGVANLQELPVTIENVMRVLYRALRRADLVSAEVAASEGWLLARPQMGKPVSPDRQAQELYRIADKNIAEYRQHLLGVLAGVERTEAQAAVFTTTLDTLRMRMLSHRLVGKDTEAPTQEFLAAMSEARMQLDSIDKALDELELSPFPQTISIMPDVAQELRATLSSVTPPPVPPGTVRAVVEQNESDGAGA